MESGFYIEGIFKDCMPKTHIGLFDIGIGHLNSIAL